MMDADTLHLVLGVLAFGLALNLKLTLSVLAASRNAAEGRKRRISTELGITASRVDGTM